MAEIRFEDVTKRFDDGTCAVSALDLEIQDGELMVLVGPSGCGKTTALRMIAGLEELTSGTIRIGERVVNDLPPKERDIAMVFQSYALYPHLTVEENIAFGLKLRRTPKPEIANRVRSVSRILDLEHLLHRKPRALSGGQRQRVAMGRAIVRQPDAFLMDEPLSNLDAKLRVSMRAEIIRLQRALSATTVYVTHDQVEAMTMGDRVGVMRAGVLQQVDSPQTLYDHPANAFVAGFIGSPAMNMFLARVETQSDAVVLHAGGQPLVIRHDLLRERVALTRLGAREVIVGVRPEQLRLTSDASDDDVLLTGSVELCEALGSDLLVHVAIDAPQVVDPDESESSDKTPQIQPRTGSLLVARLPADADAREGERITLAMSIRKLQMFDPETNAAIWN
jgi:multiple sugar transport system ATP-binding protein